MYIENRILIVREVSGIIIANNKTCEFGGMSYKKI